MAMTQLVISELNPEIIEKLKTLAHSQGRTLEAELKVILTAAVEAESSEFSAVKALAKQRIEKARQNYAGRLFSDSAELLREDRQR